MLVSGKYRNDLDVEYAHTPSSPLSCSSSDTRLLLFPSASGSQKDRIYPIQIEPIKPKEFVETLQYSKDLQK